LSQVSSGTSERLETWWHAAKDHPILNESRPGFPLS
jgi:hypothetical protein